MKSTLLFFTSSLTALLLSFTSCENKPSTDVKYEVWQPRHDKAQTAQGDSLNNAYQGFRNLAFGITAEQIGIQIPAGQTKIYGVIMDWGLEEGTATITAFLSGDASLYLSSGGGALGGIAHDNVKKAAAAFIEKAEKYLSKASKTVNTPIPQKDEVKFYFLTNNGKFVGQAQIKDFDNGSSEWLDLFEEGNKLLTEIRLTMYKPEN